MARGREAPRQVSAADFIPASSVPLLAGAILHRRAFHALDSRSDPRGRSTLCQSDDDGHWVQNEPLDLVATSTLRGDRFDIGSGGDGGPIVAGDQRAVMVAAIRARNRLVARCTE